MKSAKSTSDAPIYAQLLGAFDSAQSAYKLSKAQEGAAKHQLKTADKKEVSKLEEDVLKLQVNFAKHNRKAHKARLKIAQLGIKQWLKAHEAETTAEEVVVESKKRGRKAKTEVVVVSEPKKRGRKAKAKDEAIEAPTQIAVVEGGEAPAPKKRGRKPQPKVEVVVVESAEAPEPKKRGRKPQPKPEVVVVEGAEAPEPKKRGRKPQPKPEVVVVEGVEAPAPKKRGRQPKPKVEVEVVEATEPKRRGRPARIVAEVEEEEGVAGASARAMLAIEEKAPKAAKPAKEPKAVKEPKPAKAPKEPKAEKTASDGKRGRRPSDAIAVEKAEKEAAIKAGLKGADFRILEGIGPKVTAILHDNGIVAFRDLAAKSADDLKALMTANRQFLVNPTNWARQAQLAADGKMDELEALKAQLHKGK
jgi:predicted flap endonuclease-1-like 5' DNA nuclease